jgi:sensor histidine kinase YesM
MYERTKGTGTDLEPWPLGWWSFLFLNLAGAWRLTLLVTTSVNFLLISFIVSTQSVSALWSYSNKILMLLLPVAVFLLFLSLFCIFLFSVHFLFNVLLLISASFSFIFLTYNFLLFIASLVLSLYLHSLQMNNAQRLKEWIMESLYLGLEPPLIVTRHLALNKFPHFLSL